MMSHTLKRKPKRSIGLAAAAIACILLVVVAANFLRREAATPVVQLAKLAENLHVAMFSSGVASGPSDPSDDDKGDKGGVRVEVKVVVTAKSEPDGTPVRVDVQSALMTARLVGAFVDRRAEFVVPSDLLLDSGILVVRASTNDATGSALMQIRPDTAANGIVPLAGPRSVIADRKHWTMVSVIPQDVDGNGLADETPVRLHVRRPDGRTDIVEGAIRGLLDGIRVYGGTVAGLTTIRVEVQDATGPEVEVREVAGPPIPFRLEPPIGPLVADGRSLIAIRTPLLRDPYGNTVEDGTAVDEIGRAHV